MRLWNTFWNWYERTYTLNVSIALALFLLQIIHLIWLFGAVVWARAFGVPLFEFNGMWQVLIVLVDYTEIPAIFSVSLIYVNDLRKGWHGKGVLYLFLLIIQLLHIFWITDEFVIDMFTGAPEHMQTTILPHWLAWAAILIDYLEVPVMYDTTKRFFNALQEKEGLRGLREALGEEPNN